jgi:sn-glycerol 3-phosphate transport system substrate-binding protein
MMAAKGAIKPVYKLMADAGEPFDAKTYLPAVTGYYSTVDGKMLSLPFNSSTRSSTGTRTPSRRPGSIPNSRPRPGPRHGRRAQETPRRRHSRAASPRSGMSWMQIENFSAWHNLPIATKANGLRRTRHRLEFNGPTVIRHIGRSADAQKDKIFDYGGRKRARPKFSAANADVSGSSGSTARSRPTPNSTSASPCCPITRRRRRAAELDHRRRQPVGDGRQEARGIQGHRQVLHLSVAPDVQVDTHQATGYLPITIAAYEADQGEGFYDKNPGTRRRRSCS